MSSITDVNAMLMMVASYYPNFKVSPNMATLWHDLLADLPSDLLLQATKRHCASEKWPPKISELRQAAIAIMNNESVLSASEAWGMVQKAIQRFGRDKGKEARAYLGEHTWRVVECLGWQTLGGSYIRDMVSHRARFIEAWQSIETRESKQRLLPQGLRDGAMAVTGGKIKQLAERLRIE